MVKCTEAKRWLRLAQIFQLRRSSCSRRDLDRAGGWHRGIVVVKAADLCESSDFGTGISLLVFHNPSCRHVSQNRRKVDTLELDSEGWQRRRGGAAIDRRSPPG